MNLARLFKIAVIAITGIILITFILPYNPDEIYTPDPIGVDKNIVEKHENIHQQELPKPPQETVVIPDERIRSSKKMFVILVTGFRTGSTFIGELFNQNADVLYLFEPFHQNHIKALVAKNAIKGVSSSNTLLEQRTNYLEQIINRCEVQWPMFGGMSLNMKCGSPEENLKRFGSTQCEKGEQKWNEFCNKRDIVALKLIRLQRIEHLNLVPGIEEANVYVVHLIRDPRGTMNSRLGFGTFYLDDIENLKVSPLTPEKMGVAAANLCDREWDNIEFSTQLPDWLRGRYLRVTHDEMSLHPLETARKVYSFVGKKIPADLDEFLIDHTTVKGKGVLNTSRNSTEVLQKWRNAPKMLQPGIIQAIEQKCKKLMDFMGYEYYQPA